MKKVSYLMMMVCLSLSLFTNCSDDKDEPIEIPTSLTVDKTSFSVEASASTESFAVSSNKDWTAKTEASWLTLSPTSGKADSKLSVEITVSAHSETDARSAVITVTAADRSVEVKVDQQGKVIVPGIEIADEKFRQYLVENFDTNDDGEISTEEAEAVTVMDCSGKEISSLAGIEHFVNLDTLNCSSNSLTRPDFSKNLKLTMLNCASNQIDSLGLTENVALKTLNCSSNELAELIVSGNVNLTELNCSANKLTELVVDKNVKLVTLNCSDNQLTTLDVSKNTGLEKLDCRDNESLKQVLLSEGQTIADLLYDEESTELKYPEEEKVLISIPDANFKAYLVEHFDTDKDGEISEAEALTVKEVNCSRMEIASLTGIAAFTNLEVLVSNENKFSSIDVSKNLKLKTLECGNSAIGSIDVSKNTELERLRCYSNGLSTLNVKNNKKLTFLACYNNKLKELDLSENGLLESLYCQTNGLSSLDLKANTKLNVLSCAQTPALTTVYLEQGHTIKEIYMDSPPTSIVYPNYVTIKDEAFFAYLLSEFDSNKDGKLSEAESKEIKAIDCSELEIASLEGIELFTELTSLICSGNNLTSVNIGSNVKLTTFVCDSNKITSLNLSSNPLLETVNCAKNKLTSLNVSVNEKLVTLICNDNSLSVLNLTNNAKLETLLCQNNNLSYTMDVSNNLSLNMLDCRGNTKLVRVYLRADQEIETLLKDDKTAIAYVGENELPITIEDEEFKAYLVKSFDKNDDGEISLAEALLITDIDCSNLGIASLSGIEYMANLTSLICDGNELTSIPVQGNTKLGLLYCSDNDLSSLDLTSLTNLKRLSCRRNQIEELNLTKNVNLVYLDCQSNRLTTLSVRYNLLLETLICFDNPNLILFMSSAQEATIAINADGSATIKTPEGAIVFEDVLFENYLLSEFDTNGDGGISETEAEAITEIDCEKLGISSLRAKDGSNYVGLSRYFTNLAILKCGGNNLTSLDVSNCGALTMLFCQENKLTSLNVTDCTELFWIFCQYNELTTIDVSTNIVLKVIDCRYNTKLTTIELSTLYHDSVTVDQNSGANLVYK